MGPIWECLLFFDDRLATVLRQRVTGEAGLRTQFRQLLDLLGKGQIRAPASSDDSLLAAAWLRMDALAEAIPAAERARMIREPGWRLRNPDLAAHLAEQEPEVASAALNRADLSTAEWTALIPRMPVRARGFLRNRRDLPVDVDALLERLGVHDRGLPAPDNNAEPQATPRQGEADPPAPPVVPVAPAQTRPTPLPVRDREDTGRSEISALVERIARFRKERSSDPRAEFEHSPRLPLGEVLERPERISGSFGFATDTMGRIEWAASEVAAMVIGTRLLAATEAGIERAFARRQPVAGAPVTLHGAPAIAGDWIIDAEPRFSEEGHFAGYFGRLRRVPETSGQPPRPELREADRIRQLLHELRTPVTAVQGYAEVIQQQLFGPAPHEYRALAAAIAADAARILAGFDELDRLARMETGVMAIDPGETDFAALLRRTIAQIAPVLEPKGAALVPGFAPDTTVLAAIDPDDAEALVWRVLASLAALCTQDEQLALRLDPLIGASGAMVRLSCTLPARLATQDNLFGATPQATAGALNAGLFGAGFALRLARAEARSIGGDLVRHGVEAVLTLPLLTDAARFSSAGTGGTHAATA